MASKTALVLIAAVVILLTLLLMHDLIAHVRVNWGTDTPLLNAIKCAYYSCVLGCDHKEIEKIGEWEEPDGSMTDCKKFCGGMKTKICDVGDNEKIKIHLKYIDEDDELSKNDNTVFVKQWEAIVKNADLPNSDYNKIGIIKPGFWEPKTKPCEPVGFVGTGFSVPSSMLCLPDDDYCSHKKPWYRVRWIDSATLEPSDYVIWVDKEDVNNDPNIDDKYDVIIAPYDKNTKKPKC